ncbi:ATP-binding cassette domain-containing protein [Streptomyces sp. NPDC004284]|uniref:ATP-binding cassette domain-containing protein n=1 Tax=Streptomyces sp. NPDC004284 TaxID=3364695 RepID=UPI0036C07406
MKDHIRSVVRGRRRALVRLAGYSLLDSAPVVVSGLCVARAVDRGFAAGRPLVGFAWLSVLAAAYLVRAFAVPRLARRVADVVEPLRDDLVERAVRAALARAVAEGRTPPDHATGRVVTQVETVRRLTGAALLDLRAQVFAVTGALAGLLSLTPLFAALALVATGAAVALLVARSRTLAGVHRSSVLAGEEVSAAAGTVLRGLRDILACSAADRAGQVVAEAVDRQAAAVRAAGRAGAVRAAVVAVGGYLPLVLLLVLSPWLLREGRLSAGAVLGAAAYLSGSLVPMLRTLVQSVNAVLIPLAVNVRRLAETAAAVPPAPPLRPAGGERPGERGDLVLENVGYAYGPYARPVLTGLSMTFRHGEHVAVVGPSGLGKSTLAQLLAGTLVPDTGEVRLGGVPLRRRSAADARRAVVLVPQEGYVFTGTARENLRYLDERATDDEIARAVDEVGAAAVLHRVGGLDGRVEPAALSAGERQLLVLARAHLTRAAVTVLDEATCHLGAAAARRAEEAFARRPGVLVVIAHRLDSALLADRIVVMDGERPLDGSHDELLAVSPRYAELFGHWTDTARAADAAEAFGTAGSTARVDHLPPTTDTRNPDGSRPAAARP